MAHSLSVRSAIMLTFIVVLSFMATACHAKQQSATENPCVPLSGTAPNTNIRSTTTTYIYADNQTLAKIIKNSTGTCIQYVVG